MRSPKYSAKQEEAVIQHWQPITLNSDQVPPTPIGDSIHIWQTRFSEWQSLGGILAANLSQEEQLRIQRFRDPMLATRYIIGRGLLRELLAKYLGIAAAKVGISNNTYGKPAILAETGAKLHFNLAHTDDAVLYGFANRHPIGIDLESIDPSSISPLEVSRILSNSEWAHWQHLSDEEHISMFFQTWVRKEAVLKALGIGLSIEPDTFSVGFTPRQAITHVQGTTLCIHDLPVQLPAKAAVALIGSEMPVIRCFVANAHL